MLWILGILIAAAIGLVALILYAWFFVLGLVFCLSGVAAVFLMGAAGYPSKIFFPVGGVIGVIAVLLIYGNLGANKK